MRSINLPLASASCVLDSSLPKNSSAFEKDYESMIFQGREENKKTKHLYAQKDEKALLNRMEKYRHNHLLFLHNFAVLIFRTVDSLKIYDMPFVLTQGGPGNSTEFLSLHIYRLANAQNGLIGRAAANAIILMLISTAVSKVLIHYQRRGDA